MSTQTKELPLSKADSWKMFDEISPKYDFLNHFLSFGQDILWRKKLAQFLPKRSGINILDLATGTADVLLSFFHYCDNIDSAHGIDMSENMLAIGRQKVEQKNLQKTITLEHGDMNQLPFQRNSFDAVSIAFGIRNVENPLIALKEMYRVLRPEGRVLILEFSLPQNTLWKKCHLFYLRQIVPFIGSLFSGHQEAYRYLNQTIEVFPYGGAFCTLMRKAGFDRISAQPLMGGIATIYQGEKLT